MKRERDPSRCARVALPSPETRDQYSDVAEAKGAWVSMWVSMWVFGPLFIQGVFQSSSNHQLTMPMRDAGAITLPVYQTTTFFWRKSLGTTPTLGKFLLYGTHQWPYDLTLQPGPWQRLYTPLSRPLNNAGNPLTFVSSKEDPHSSFLVPRSSPCQTTSRTNGSPSSQLRADLVANTPAMSPS